MYTAAAPLICAGTTTCKGIKKTQTRRGQWLVISGIGGLGHPGVQYAKAMGLDVCAVDIDDAKRAQATRLGADAVVNARHPDAVKADIELQRLSAINKVFERLAHGGLTSRVVLDFAVH
jgi:propanol-preferring alcohol dehydrogenase